MEGKRKNLIMTNTFLDELDKIPFGIYSKISNENFITFLYE